MVVLLAANCFPPSIYAQKHFFQHYDIENGLLQSQVTSIAQDRNNQLWIATLGGVNCFDSRQFTPFTVEDGLPDNASFAIATDKKGQIWFGNSKGITTLDQRGVKNYPFAGQVSTRGVRRIVTDGDDNKWVLAGYKFFKLAGGKLTRQFVTADSEMVSAIQVNKKGEVFAAVYKKGVYKLENNVWRFVFGFGTPNDPLSRSINYFIFDSNDSEKIYFITSEQLFSYSMGRIEAESKNLFKKNHTELTRLLPDNEGGLWIGSSNGAYLLKNGAITFFNENNGFTNARVLCMFKDSGGNLWFGTDGSGLYQYPHSSFLIYDKTQGLNNDVVMGLAKGSDDKVFISTYGTGLFSYKNNAVAEVKLTGSGLAPQKINCIYEDSGNTLWMGTDNSELWKKNGQTVTRVFPKSGEKGDGLFTSILKAGNSRLWLATGRGCFYLRGDDPVKINGIDEYCTSLLEIGKDSLLVGAQTGLKLIRNEHVDTSYQSGFPNLLVLCLRSYGNFLFAGSNDRGLFVWNKSAKSFENITTKQGLNSNSVLSMQIVNDQLWVGTGRGVNKFILRQKGNHLSVVPTPFSGIFSECNENAMLKIGDYMGVGTTHGLNLYPISGNLSLPPAKIVIENIQTYTTHLNSQGYMLKDGYKLPRVPSLPSGESHISIRFQAIQYDASKTYYEYKLDGLDAGFSKPVQNNVVDYASLPPSSYVFLVKTVTSGGESAPVSYNFTITPAFYQTIIFRILIVLLFLLSVLGAYLYKTYLDRRKNIFIARLRLIEQENVRRQTAEDFHDDLGNKLTRINMLSELLDKKISPELPDQKTIIRQIRAGVGEMYSGTKNILWAMNPKNDHLGEILTEVKLFGESLFDNTSTSFTMLPYEESVDKIKVPLGYSHNMMLIFKELINNILKHAQASEVTFAILAASYSKIYFKITDDGKGYQTDNAFPGNGLRNVQNRSKKLNGEIITASQPGKGTITTLIITVP
ncbi:MAG TPA: two-component regulator propeller domain-containing protein [Mucilaginibacter sp.]|nr:two-component regulator propeller domain-containing protein [Mucilaginibacter sp.]